MATQESNRRTTVVLDEDARQAARDLAHRYGCSASEAIRRAILHHRDTVFGISEGTRTRRRQVLEDLFALFQDNDPEEEIRRLKSQDEGF